MVAKHFSALVRYSEGDWFAHVIGGISEINFLTDKSRSGTAALIEGCETNCVALREFTGVCNVRGNN